jgi:hypothetical protein
MRKWNDTMVGRLAILTFAIGIVALSLAIFSLALRLLGLAVPGFGQVSGVQDFIRIFAP